MNDKTSATTGGFSEFWRRNQALLLQFPLMFGLLLGCYVLLKSLDPKIGIEGFGDLFGYALNGVRVTLIIFTAWWMKRRCWFDIHRTTELELFKLMQDPKDMSHAWLIFWVVVRDRLEWVVSLGYASYWFTR